MRGASQVAGAGSAAGPPLLARRLRIVPIVVTVVAWAMLTATAPLSAWTIAGAADSAAASPDGHLTHSGVFTQSGLLMLALMTVAMMAPLAIPGILLVASASPRQRADRPAAWFFAVFLLTWIVVAVVFAPFATALGTLLGSSTAAAGILVVACVLVEFDPQRRAVGAPCGPPMQLHGNGSSADLGGARFGLLTACRGVRLCALPMIAMLAIPSSLLVMALLTAASVIDRFTLGRRRLVIAAGYAAMGIVLLI